jgi:hypothetical protein
MNGGNACTATIDAGRDGTTIARRGIALARLFLGARL